MDKPARLSDTGCGNEADCEMGVKVDKCNRREVEWMPTLSHRRPVQLPDDHGPSPFSRISLHDTPRFRRTRRAYPDSVVRTRGSPRYCRSGTRLLNLTSSTSFTALMGVPGHVFLSTPWTAALACAGVALDQILGEPRRAHPLIGFGRYAGHLEQAMNRDRPPLPQYSHRSWRACAQRLTGLVAWMLAVIPPVVFAVVLLQRLPFALAYLLHVLLLWFALGARSLRDHLRPIAQALTQGELAQARVLTARIVTRDTSDADETALARAAVESALENGNDAIFATLFWFALAGGPGALAFRLLNTLDAMWGYRTPRLLYFGWAAARLDDLANWLPARLTAATYALCGNWRGALQCWRTQAPTWDSPNAGPVMASGAGSLSLQLGGVARYHGVDEIRPRLGAGAPPVAADIVRALRLLRHSLTIWLCTLAMAALFMILRNAAHG